MIKNKKQKIPKNLDECFICLDKMKIDNFFNGEENQDTFDCHFLLGPLIINDWGLSDHEKKGELRQFFIDNGVSHTDDMCSIILTSYHRYKNNNKLLIT